MNHVVYSSKSPASIVKKKMQKKNIDNVDENELRRRQQRVATKSAVVMAPSWFRNRFTCTPNNCGESFVSTFYNN